MNIFGIGGAELVLILLILLIVAGPKRMARWAFVMGHYVGKFRRMWSEMVDLVQKEINDAGMDVTLPKEPPNRQTINRWVNEAAKPLSEPIQGMAREIESDMKQIDESARGQASSATSKPAASTNKAGGATPAASKPAVAAGSASMGAWSSPEKPATPPSQPPMSLGAWSNPGNPNPHSSSGNWRQRPKPEAPQATQSTTESDTATPPSEDQE